jgi:hypothetical protein
MNHESARVAAARRYALRKAAGLCVICEAPAPVGVHCDGCADAHAEGVRETYALRASNGLCLRCKNDAVPGRALCRPHARAERDRQRRLRRERARAEGREFYPRRRRSRTRAIAA